MKPKNYRLTFSRSSGPGGQNVNKLNTKATLHWDPARDGGLPLEALERLRRLYPQRFTEAGEVVISSQRFRSQQRNVQDCLAKLEQMLTEALTPPRPRKATRPKRSAVEKRLTEKRRQSERKQSRQKGFE